MGFFLLLQTRESSVKVADQYNNIVAQKTKSSDVQVFAYLYLYLYLSIYIF